MATGAVDGFQYVTNRILHALRRITGEPVPRRVDGVGKALIEETGLHNSVWPEVMFYEDVVVVGSGGLQGGVAGGDRRVGAGIGIDAS